MYKTENFRIPNCGFSDFFLRFVLQICLGLLYDKPWTSHALTNPDHVKVNYQYWATGQLFIPQRDDGRRVIVMAAKYKYRWMVTTGQHCRPMCQYDGIVTDPDP